jgi:hypothetical protein
MIHNIKKSANMLGLSGLLPQLALFLVALSGGEWADASRAMAGAYAALIFSFLGGVWWGLALLASAPPRWAYIAAVMPSLIALASALPVALGVTGLGPSMALLGLSIAASPLVDRALLRHIEAPKGWLRLRWILSLGLGALTILTALA